MSVVRLPAGQTLQSLAAPLYELDVAVHQLPEAGGTSFVVDFEGNRCHLVQGATDGRFQKDAYQSAEFGLMPDEGNFPRLGKPRQQLKEIILLEAASKRRVTIGSVA